MHCHGWNTSALPAPPTLKTAGHWQQRQQYQQAVEQSWKTRAHHGLSVGVPKILEVAAHPV